MATRGNFVSRLRSDVVALLSIINTVKQDDLQWQAEGYSGNIVAGDLTGANADLVPADVTNFIVSIEAVLNLLSANGNAHYTNLMKALP